MCVLSVICLLLCVSANMANSEPKAISSTPKTTTTSSPTNQQNVVTTVISVLVGVTVVGALLMCGFFLQKKIAKDRKKDHDYESVEDVKPAANENNYEAIYVLAGDSAIVSLGKKTDTEASSSSETKAPKNQGESVYSTVQYDTTMPRDVTN